MGYSYRDLIVWQKAVDLAEEVYVITKQFPRDEQYGLSAQLRRAAVSVASNIAEGQGRLTKKDFRHFLGQARGSLLETETQMLIASRLHYVSQQQFHTYVEHSGTVSRFLHRLIESMSKDENDAIFTR